MSDTDVTDKQPQDNPDEAEAQLESDSRAPLEADSVEELQAKLTEAENRAQENWENLLRANAEMDNLRRRTERELENAHKYAVERFAQELLAVRDSLEMGVAAAEQEEASVEKIKEGTELTLRMLEGAMDKFNIQPIDPQDEPFDPERHQAMSTVETPDKAPNTVINVMQKGYMLNDRLIRPAMVIVSRAPEANN
ncbi:nucleotide exchange factor GrpE [Thiohalophilus thiocyanatoxydans]|uniref:Protein GrpE n=1 Tax=Thiohalophilus thiocyanatoxydans TaxID=381308 RepID=A0A4R8INL8_9GAMM|nr:nucleotide exchange factor GrpE [Thiohalophilus thiocyanatoxydans]TDY02466.1 molecular chaperone GrpE [Thiohalophilus thiocyanatoxydans]